VGDFNTPLSPIDRSSKQKINKEILELNHTIDQMDLADVYRIFHPTSAQYTFFSTAHGTFSKIDHVLGHKASRGKYKKIEKVPCILSDHNAL
jgi:exonuclease III